MTDAESIARQVLETFSGVYYTAKDETGRKRAVKEAAKALEPAIASIAARVRAECVANPS